MLRLIPCPSSLADDGCFDPASPIINHIHTLADQLCTIAVDYTHSPASYSQLLSKTLAASLTTRNASTEAGLGDQQRRHMLLQLPYFLLQKALWPVGSGGSTTKLAVSAIAQPS